MIQLYDGTEYAREKNAKKRFLTVWFVLLGIVALIDIGCIVWNAVLPYKSPLAVYPKTIAFVLSALFAFFSFPVLAIKLRRMRFYVKILSYLQNGLKEGWTGELISFSQAVEVREGVDFHSMSLYEFNERRSEYFVRKVLIDCEKPLPDIKPGDMLHYITQSNILVEYEIVKRPENEPSTKDKKASVAKKDRREEIKNCAQ